MAKENNSNSLEVFLSARELSITDDASWNWASVKGNINRDFIEVAELIGSSQLKIDGKYNERKLKRRVNYEVLFVVQLEDNLAIDDPVELTLALSDGTTLGGAADLNCMPKNRWIGLKVADFIAEKRAGGGDMTFTMKKISDHTKKGIIIIGAVISAKL